VAFNEINATHCHVEPFDKLRTGKLGINAAKHLSEELVRISLSIDELLHFVQHDIEWFIASQYHDRCCQHGCGQHEGCRSA
jgi:hypothetical protein